MAEQVVPGVYTFTGLMVGRVYLIEDAEGPTLVDAGMGDAPAKIARQMGELGYQPGDAKRILITHAHLDHVGGLPELQRLTGAEVVASEGERPFIKSALVDRTIAGGDRLAEVMGGLEVVSTPGHSPGHVVYWQPEKRILFCGDVLMHFFARLSLPFRMATPDMDENIRSIGRVVALEPEVVCFGHGPPLTQGAAEAVRRFARKVGAI